MSESQGDLYQQAVAEYGAALDRLVRAYEADPLLQLIHRLRPMGRQVMLLYIEDMDAESIGEITGISAGDVRVQIHRKNNSGTRPEIPQR